MVEGSFNNELGCSARVTISVATVSSVETKKKWLQLMFQMNLLDHSVFYSLVLSMIELLSRSPLKT